MKAIKVTGNILIVIGIIISLSLSPYQLDDMPSAYFWIKEDWYIFLFSYILVATGFLFRSITNNTYFYIRNLFIFLYMTGFFVITALWEFQKYIRGTLGEVIGLLIYIISFFYALSFMLFVDINKKVLIKDWVFYRISLLKEIKAKRRRAG